MQPGHGNIGFSPRTKASCHPSAALASSNGHFSVAVKEQMCTSNVAHLTICKQ